MQTSFFLSLAAIAGFAVWSLDASAAKVSRAAVAADCRTEGKAMGIPASDLDEYVSSCLEEFFGSSLVNNRKQSAASAPASQSRTTSE